MDAIKKTLSAVVKVLSFRVPLPFFILLLVLVGTIWATADFARKKPEYFGLIKGASIIQKEEEELVRSIGQLIELPGDEKPTVATVTEETKLKEQEFFSKTKNGDKVLIYTNAKQVVIYRPSENRIVSVGSVNISQQEEVAEDLASSSPSPSPKATPEPEEQPSE